MTNKVRYGLKNVHYAVATEDSSTGVITYGTPVRFPGAVSLTLDTRGDTSEFYADDTTYYTTSTNNGYEGTYEVAEIPLEFRTAVLGEQISADGIITETTNDRISPIALLFEFNGDVKATRHVLYNVTMSRPSISGETTTDTSEPQTSELTFVASAGNGGVVKRSTSGTVDDVIYDAWYSTVYIPTP